MGARAPRMEAKSVWSCMARTGKENVATTRGGADNEEETSEATDPFFPPLREGGSIFVYSRKERYDTTTASKASNPNLSCQYSFFSPCLPDSRPLILLFYHFQFFFYSVYRLTRPPESNRSRSFKLFFLLFLRSTGQVVFEMVFAVFYRSS